MVVARGPLNPLNQTIDVTGNLDLRKDLAEAMHKNNWTQLQGEEHAQGAIRKVPAVMA